MKGRLSVGLLVVALVVAMLPLGGATGATLGKYIVVLKDSVQDPQAIAKEHAGTYGFKVREVYKHALKGYAADMTAQQARSVSTDARVAWS